MIAMTDLVEKDKKVKKTKKLLEILK